MDHWTTKTREERIVRSPFRGLGEVTAAWTRTVAAEIVTAAGSRHKSGGLLMGGKDSVKGTKILREIIIFWLKQLNKWEKIVLF